MAEGESDLAYIQSKGTLVAGITEHSGQEGISKLSKYQNKFQALPTETNPLGHYRAFRYPVGGGIAYSSLPGL